MTRFVCLLLVSVVACSEVRDRTLLESCQEFCPNAGAFLQGPMEGMDAKLVGMMHQWLEDNEYMDRTWGCDDLWEIIQTVWKKMKEMEENHSDNSLEDMTREMKPAVQKWIMHFATTMLNNVSQDCREKFEDLRKQIM